MTKLAATRGRRTLLGAVLGTTMLSPAATSPDDFMIHRFRTGCANATGDPVVIGTSFAMDYGSKCRQYGRIMRQTYELLIEYFTEARGGIYVDGPDQPPRPFEFLIKDFSSIKTVQNIYNTMLPDMGFRLLPSTCSSGLRLWAAADVNTTNAVLMTPCGTQPRIYLDRPNVFGIIGSAENYPRGPFKATGHTSAKSISVVKDPDFRIGICDVVPELAATYSMEIKEWIDYAPDITNTEMAEAVARLALDPPDVVIACTYYNPCRYFMETMIAQRPPVKAVLLLTCPLTATYTDLFPWGM